MNHNFSLISYTVLNNNQFQNFAKRYTHNQENKHFTLYQKEVKANNNAYLDNSFTKYNNFLSKDMHYNYFNKLEKKKEKNIKSTEELRDDFTKNCNYTYS